jgi:hypothetical protein
MQDMKKWTLFNLAAGASLLVFIAGAGLWIIGLCMAPSGGSRGWIVRTEPDESHRIVGVSRTGWVTASRAYPLPQGPAFRGAGRNDLRSRPTELGPSVPGIAVTRWEIREPRADGTVVRHLTNQSTQFHLGWLLLLGAILPGGSWGRRWLLARRAMARMKQGRCPSCSYDLRATPAGERCPECGAGGRNERTEVVGKTAGAIAWGASATAM